MRLAAAPAVIAVLLFAVPATAKAPIIELGGVGGLPAPSCTGTAANDRAAPKGLGRCSVLTRTTVYPTIDGRVENPTTVPRTSRIVAVTLRLGMLKDSCARYAYKTVKGKRTRYCADNFAEKTYFDKTFGSGSRARLVVLKPVAKPRGSRAVILKKVATLGPEMRLERWFGKTVTVPLATTIQVVKGDVIGLTVPTYAPILPMNSGDAADRWRASRPPGGFKPLDPRTGAVVTRDPATGKAPDPCSTKWGVIFQQTALTTIGKTADFRCRYAGTPTFEVTLIPVP